MRDQKGGRLQLGDAGAVGLAKGVKTLQSPFRRYRRDGVVVVAQRHADLLRGVAGGTVGGLLGAGGCADVAYGDGPQARVVGGLQVIDEVFGQVEVVGLRTVEDVAQRVGVVGIVADDGVVLVGLHHPTLPGRPGQLFGRGGVHLAQAHTRPEEQGVPQAAPLLGIPRVEYVTHLGRRAVRERRGSLLEFVDQVGVDVLLGVIHGPHDLVRYAPSGFEVGNVAVGIGQDHEGVGLPDARHLQQVAAVGGVAGAGDDVAGIADDVAVVVLPQRGRHVAVILVVVRAGKHSGIRRDQLLYNAHVVDQRPPDAGRIHQGIVEDVDGVDGGRLDAVDVQLTKLLLAGGSQ